MSSRPKSAARPAPRQRVSIEITRYSGLLDVSDERLSSIATSILPRGYRLSLVLCGDRRMRRLNETYRGKGTPANVLSFPLGKDAGEIFLNPARARREARSFELSPEGHLEYLLIHGCLHLKGLDHGSTMDRAEVSYRKQFGVR